MNKIIDDVADKIFKAHQSKKPIHFIREQYTLDEATSYAIQDEVISRKCADGKDEIAGYKISMTSAETQAIANTYEPAYGTILKSNVKSNNETISLSNLFAPLIEVEMMFILQENFSMGAKETEIIEKTAVAPGIEIPDARYIDWFPNFTLADLLCDNTATGLVALADPIETLSINNITEISVDLIHNNEKIDAGVASAVLGNPIKAVKWLSEKLASKNKQLKKGMIISSGTFTTPIPVKEGAYKATFSELGEIKVTFQQ